MLNDFRKLGFNQAETGQKVFDGHMQWIAAADGLNLNLRFSQPGPHGAQPPGPPVRGRHVPVRERELDRPHHGQDRRPLRQVHGNQHLPVRDGDLLGQRVLGEGRVAVPHEHARHGGSARASA